MIDPLPPDHFYSQISTYGIMLALGFITANYLLQREFHRLNYDPRIADNLIILLAIGGILGAKIFFFWESSSQWHGWAGFMELLKNFGGGLTWYGGFIVSNIFAYIYLRKVKMSYLHVADVGAHVMAMGYVFGRLGCFVSGDGCYGIAAPAGWPAPFAMAFPNGAAPWSEIVQRYHDPNVIVYNTPLFEASFSFLLFLFFYLIRKKEWPLGVKFMTFILLHSIFRFFVEFIRLNPRDVFGVSQAQFLSIILVAMAIVYYVYKRKEIVARLSGVTSGSSGHK